MSVLRYIRLDVFANQPFSGIQLAVFPDVAGIDERRMQGIANEMALWLRFKHFLALLFGDHPRGVFALDPGGCSGCGPKGRGSV